MSIQWADDFGAYGLDGSGAARMLNGLYAAVVGGITPDPDPSGAGDPVWFRGDGSNQCLRRVMNTMTAEAGFCARVFMSHLPADTSRRWGFGLNDIDDNPLLTLVCETTGALSIKKQSFTDNNIATTTGPVLTANAWNHIEVRANNDDVAGAMEVRVNGMTVLTVTDQPFSGAPFAQWVMQSLSGGAGYSFYLRDLVLWDTSGTYCNDFLGSVVVYGLVTTPPDVALNWDLTGAASGAAALANVPPLDNTQYISADNTPPAASVFAMTNLPTDVTSVKAIVTQVRTRKTDGGDGNLQIGLKSSTDVGLGADRPITVAYTYYNDVFHVDPHTDAPWSPGAVDAAQLQVNRTV